MSKTVFMFPGQGSQFVGMGKDLHDEFVIVKELFDMVEDICKAHIRDLCFKGPMEELTKTVNLQPAVTAVNLACLMAVLNEKVKPDMAAGHSLGEFSALCAAGALTPEDVFRLVFRRGKLMHREAEKNKGAMSAIMKLDIDAVSKIVEQAREAGPVSVANHNTHKQIVITGSKEGVKRASELAAEQKGRAIRLKVSGAWHSEFMEGAKKEFAEFLGEFSFMQPDIPVVMNVTGKPCQDAGEMAEIMSVQLVSQVRWCDSLLAMQKEGAETFVEIGPKNVLAGMAKQVLAKDKPAAIHNVGDMKSLEKFFKEIS